MKMSREQDHLESIREMRSLMERSSRYLSLSGLAGVIVGIIALGGVVWVHYSLNIGFGEDVSFNELMASGGASADSVRNTILWTALVVFVLSVVFEVTLASRKAQKLGLPIWDATARRMFTALAVPVAGGGIYCLSLILSGNPDGLAPATLIFYGLGLINAGKYAIPDVGRLGFAVFVTGLTASFFPGWGLLFWAIGFGILHIIYGITIHFKHER